MYVEDMDLKQLYIIFLFVTTFKIPCFALHEKLLIQNVTCNNYGISIQIDVGEDFNGKVYVASQYYNPFCRYDADTTTSSIVFEIAANNCDTFVRVLEGYIYYSNNIVIQRHRFIETPWDETHNVSCKIKIPKMTGKLDDPDQVFKFGDLKSWIEFKTGSHVFDSQPVNQLTVGDNFLLTIHLKDAKRTINMRVRNCWVHDSLTLLSSNYSLQVYNNRKCKSSSIFSDFSIIRNVDQSELVSYAYVKAFKLPSTLTHHITCRVALCKFDCENYCEPLQSNIDSHTKSSRNLNKRSVPDETLTINSEKRIKLLKATINALGKKLIKDRSQRLIENDSNFGRRISVSENTDGTIEEVTADVIEDVYTGATSDFKMIMIDAKQNLSITENDDHYWEDEHYFNITANIVILSAHKINHKSERASPVILSCIHKSRYITVTSLLSSFLFFLILVCIGLSLYLRKEKKKHKINNFLLYNYC